VQILRANDGARDRAKSPGAADGVWGPIGEREPSSIAALGPMVRRRASRTTMKHTMAFQMAVTGIVTSSKMARPITRPRSPLKTTLIKNDVSAIFAL
jgi:hypothetical protein